MTGKIYFLITSFTFLAHLGFAISLRLTNVSIPQYAVKDGSVVLACEFDQSQSQFQNENLLVLKWYHNSNEFFRFSPNSNILTFPQPGINIDLTRSNLNQVHLKNITLETSGLYKCEITSQPSFRTLFRESDMIVIAPPQGKPEIRGIISVAKLGEVLTGNCTIRKTKPAASLMLYINGEKALVTEVIEYSPVLEDDNLESSVLGLNIPASPRHFRNGKMELKCTATLGNGYWVTSKTVQEAQAFFKSQGQKQQATSGQDSRYFIWRGKQSFIFLLLSSSIAIYFV